MSTATFMFLRNIGMLFQLGDIPVAHTGKLFQLNDIPVMQVSTDIFLSALLLSLRKMHPNSNVPE